MARRTVKEVSDDLDKLIDRTDVVRQSINDLELKLALLQQRTDDIEKDLSGIFGSFSWAWRAVGGLLIAAVVAFVISGGLVK
jgi:hypothetical protein